MGKVLLPVLVSIMILGIFGFSEEAFASHNPNHNPNGGWQAAVADLQSQIDSFFDIFVEIEVFNQEVSDRQAADDTIDIELVALDLRGQSCSVGDTVTGFDSNNDIICTTDEDADPTNELQTLEITGNELKISNGNTVNLPSGSHPSITCVEPIFNTGWGHSGFPNAQVTICKNSDDLVTINGQAKYSGSITTDRRIFTISNHDFNPHLKLVFPVSANGDFARLDVLRGGGVFLESVPTSGQLVSVSGVSYYTFDGLPEHDFDDKDKEDSASSGSSAASGSSGK